jgi:hypothetical protein
LIFKGGIRILQLEVPYRLGTVRVKKNGNEWIIKTTNIRRLGFVLDKRLEGLSSWVIDSTAFSEPPKHAGPSYLKSNDMWEVFVFQISRLLLIYCGLVAKDILPHMYLRMFINNRDLFHSFSIHHF